MSGILQMVLSSGGGFNFSPTISVSTNNYNVKTEAIAAGWNQASPLNATITINSGVVVGSTSYLTPALSSGSTFPTGSTLTVINNGTIKGKGGAGSACGWTSSASGYWAPNGGGYAGGDALLVALTTTFDNTSGVVAGAGGGAGYIGGYTGDSSSGGASGGGGAGANVGEAASLSIEGVGIVANSSAGTSTTGGAGSNYVSIQGPSGGNLGAAGQDGTYYTFGGGSVPTAGGAAGLCVSGVAFVNGGTGITNGTTYGAQT